MLKHSKTWVSAIIYFFSAQTYPADLVIVSAKADDPEAWKRSYFGPRGKYINSSSVLVITKMKDLHFVKVFPVRLGYLYSEYHTYPISICLKIYMVYMQASTRRSGTPG